MGGRWWDWGILGREGWGCVMDMGVALLGRLDVWPRIL